MSKSKAIVSSATPEEMAAAIAAREGYTVKLAAIKDGGAEHLSETVPAAMAGLVSQDRVESAVGEMEARLKDARAVRDAQTKFRADVVDTVLTVAPKTSQSTLGSLMFADGYTGANKTWLSREWAIRESLAAAKSGKASLTRAQATKLLRNTNASQRAEVNASLRKGTVPEVAPTVEGAAQERTLPAVKAARIISEMVALSNLIARCEEATADQQAEMRRILAAIDRKIPATVVASNAGKATA